MKIRLAQKEDLDFFYQLKCEDFNIFWVCGSEKPAYENIKKFFYDAVERADDPQKRKIYIVENEEGIRVGHLYIIPDGDEFDLPVAICQEWGGRGYARQAIKMGLEEGRRLGFKRMVGSIREDNIASLKAYTSCGVKVMDDYREVYVPMLDKTVKMFIVAYDYT